VTSLLKHPRVDRAGGTGSKTRIVMALFVVAARVHALRGSRGRAGPGPDVTAGRTPRIE